MGQNDITDIRNLKILLVGQPNVGKSSLFNALVGSTVVVSNYPGTSVEITKAEKLFSNTKVNFVDTPGIYSISDRSEEEKVTEKALFEEEVDGVIIIVDKITLFLNFRSFRLKLNIPEISCINLYFKSNSEIISKNILPIIPKTGLANRIYWNVNNKE